ncbi:bcl-2 associated athanogene 3-like protein [Rhodotorula toruloides]|uniref:Bcl-2 associated athanogene 3-like protein n=1 Tax=Rhodotorula toruloides TaxID=5286 RepID=A0A511KAA8_RHOTO|nr:bcl-2 associated athanogene 3-like protein [Rhodotorula toruloides]
MFASTSSPFAVYQQQLEYAVYVAAQQHQQQQEEARRQRLHQQRQAEMAFAAAVEPERRRQRRLAIERLVAAQEAERRRHLQEEQARQRAIEEALAYRAALAAEVGRRRAVIEAAHRAVYVAREQQRRRQEFEMEQRRRAVEARRARQRQLPVSQALLEVLIELAIPALEAEAAAALPRVDKGASVPTPSPRPSDKPAPAPAAPEPASSTSEPVPSPSTSPSPAAVPPSTTPKPAEAVDEPAPAPSAEETSEATSGVDRQSALDAISALRADLESHQSAFVSPPELTFQSSMAPDSTPSTPPLSYGKSNTAFLAYEDYLVSLLSKIDAIESHGDEAVKQARKDLVRHVEKELDRLDELKDVEWERQSQRSSAVASPTHSDVEEEIAQPQASSGSTGHKMESNAPAVDAAADYASPETVSPSTEPIDQPTATSPEPADEPTEPAERSTTTVPTSSDADDASAAPSTGAPSSSRPSPPRPGSGPIITAFAGVALPSIFDAPPPSPSTLTPDERLAGEANESAELDEQDKAVVGEVIEQAASLDPALAPLDKSTVGNEQEQTEATKEDTPPSEADTEEFVVV